MPARTKLLRTRSATFAAFALTVGVALLPLYIGGQFSIAAGRGQALLALALLYVTVALFDEELMGGTQAPEWRRGLYFVVQIALVGAICALTKLNGMSALCLLPLVSNMVATLRPFPAAVSVSAVFAVYLTTYYWSMGTRGMVGSALSMLAGFSFVIVFTRIAVRENEGRGRAEELSKELATANGQLREYSRRVEDLAMTRERNRMAREIHDSLGHYLTTVAVQLEAAQALYATEPERALGSIAKAHGLTQEALIEVRRSVGALRAEGPDRPLPERLRELAVLEAGAPVTLTLLGEPRGLGPEVAHGLYRTVQEGLTNVRKHADARTVEVILDYRDSTRVIVVVANDGERRAPPSTPLPVRAGSDSDVSTAQPVGGFGLRGLRERVELLGGQIGAGPGENGGFRLRVEVPA